MDGSSLIGPVVVAAGISALVAWLTTLRRFEVDRELAEKKNKLEITLVEQKFEFDKALAKHKVDLDTSLAERKFALDQELAVWQRRYDLAEEVLTAAYEARAALDWSRGRGIFEGEGRTRKATEVGV